MIIKSIHVKHYRCILNEILNCEPLTAIVGANGAGKSSFLRALELFYASSPRFGQDDFYNKETNEDIEITVTYTDLEGDARNKFGTYLDGEELTVTRVLSLLDAKLSAKFYGTKLQNIDFAAAREAGNAMAIRQKYGELKQKPVFWSSYR